MKNGLEILLNGYRPVTEEDWENALKEVVQHLSLLGLWRSGFYEHAAFYGGTALRIFHGLRRFSEDIDFSLLKKNTVFKLAPHLSMIQSELESFGFDFAVEKKSKKPISNIESAFIKGNTIKNLIVVEASSRITGRFHKNKVVKVKLELDVDPPGSAGYEMKTLLTPIPFQVRIFSPPDLFAGKLHAVLCRNWKNRIKGRDYYDMIWFLGNKIPCRLDHLKARMVQTGHWDKDRVLDREALLSELTARFKRVDFKAAKSDVTPFIRDHRELDLWERDFFTKAIEQLQVC